MYGRMYGRGRGMWIGMWPGRGPFSFLPPWQRPFWIFGRGACWLLAPHLAYGARLQAIDELAALEGYRRELEEEIKGVEARIEELRKQKSK